jgi:spore germination protein GerM
MIGGPDPSLETPPRRGRGRVLFWGLFIALVAAASWLLFWPRGRESRPAPDPVQPDADTIALRPVTLYFGDESGSNLLSERREVSAGGSLESRVEACMQALADGPEQQGAVRTLPPGARVRRVFWDDDQAALYLDFDPALVTRHPGGSAAEYFTLGSIVRTVGSNFPEVARVQLLVEGQPIESVAGHFDASRPLEIATWR